MRLKLKRQEFDYTIVYKKGKENGNCDGLSRMFSATEPEGAVINALAGEIQGTGLISDIEGLEVTEGKCKKKTESEISCRKLGEKEKLDILKEIHDSPFGAHADINRTDRKLKQFMDWPGMKNDIEKYISTFMYLNSR
jgi:hypothetical protein